MKNWLVAMLVSLALSGPVLARGVITLDGQPAPDFKGKSFQTYAVGAVNVVPRFRDYLEQKHAGYINKETGNNESAREFRLLFPRNGGGGKELTLEEIKKTLASANVQVFVFINIEDRGGANLKGIDTMDKALLAAANFRQPEQLATYYGASDVVLYELATGKVIWHGQGVVKAKPHTPKWFRKSSVLHAKILVQHLRDSALLGASDVTTASSDARNRDAKDDLDDKLAEPQEGQKKEQDI